MKFKCSDCGRVKSNKYKRTGVTGYTLCEDCFNEDFFTCKDCGHPHWKSHEGASGFCYLCSAECYECGTYKSVKETRKDLYENYLCTDCLNSSHKLFIKVEEHADKTSVCRTKELIME